MMKLDDIRRRIDAVDEEILSLLNQRAALVVEVRHAKQEGNIDIYSPARELQILDRIKGLAHGGAFPEDAALRVFSAIISGTRSLVGELNVAYLGPECSLAHEATSRQFGDDVRSAPSASIQEVFDKVESGEAHHGVVPIEIGNGVVQETLACLYNSSLRIVAEVKLPHRLALAGKGGSLAGLDRVYSDSRSFTDASEWLQANLPGTELVLAESFTRAAKRAEEDARSALLGAELFIERTGLTILASGIENRDSDNARYVVLGKTVPAPSGKDKTSIIASVTERSGALRDLLAPFALRSLSLSKIESRPIKRIPGDFCFFIDLPGHESDELVKDAVAELRNLVPTVKILGSYPAAFERSDI